MKVLRFLALEDLVAGRGPSGCCHCLQEDLLALESSGAGV